LHAEAPNSKKFNPYFVTHWPVDSSTVVVALVVAVVLVVGEVVAVVVVVGVLVGEEVTVVDADVVCELVAELVTVLVCVEVGVDVTEVVGVVTWHSLKVPAIKASVIKFSVKEALSQSLGLMRMDPRAHPMSSTSPAGPRYSFNAALTALAVCAHSPLLEATTTATPSTSRQVKVPLLVGQTDNTSLSTPTCAAQSWLPSM
jgi:hypothetical protein